ncbi:MAG: hypothetical protein AAF497_06130, partial [Planctomycetota bacterium]
SFGPLRYSLMNSLNPTVHRPRSCCPVTLENVPVAVLDVTNPSDPGNIVPGIIGMNLFSGRDIIMDANPSVGQGGTGPSLYISDPVTQDHA